MNKPSPLRDGFFMENRASTAQNGKKKSAAVGLVLRIGTIYAQK